MPELETSVPDPARVLLPPSFSNLHEQGACENGLPAYLLECIVLQPKEEGGLRESLLGEDGSLKSI